jgi:hypothetical protein
MRISRESDTYSILFAKEKNCLKRNLFLILNYIRRNF